MAEKYGEIPKRFTAAWWEHYWMYYKWHTIATLVVILMIVVTAVQCANKVEYDLNVNYAGKKVYSQDVVNSLQTEMEKYGADADKDGEVKVFIQQLNFSNDAASAEMDYALQVKHDVELSSDISFLYLYDEKQATVMSGRESSGDIYMKVSDWTNKSENKVIKTQDGVPIMISVSGSRMLEDLGIDTDGLYMAVRLDYSGEEISEISQKGAIDIANKILEK